MRSSIAKNLLLNSILLLGVLSSVEIISEDLSVFNANALISKSQANAQKTQAVKIAIENEQKIWQTKVSESQNKIQNLQNDLNKAIAESKKLSTEKTTSEKTSKENLEKVTKEKTNAINELTDSKKKFESTSKNLNDSISNLKKEITTKEAEKNSLSQKVAAAEKSRKDYEIKVKKDQVAEKQKFDTQIKNLNTKISQTTNQLKKKTADLKKLGTEYELQKSNTSVSEAKYLVDIEVLMGEVIKLKTDLKSTIEKAKELENEKLDYIKNLQKKSNIERKHFVSIVIANQNLELKKLAKIEELTNLLNILTKKNLGLAAAGKVLEDNLTAKIANLTKKQAIAQKKYALIIKAYREAELKNLYTVDSLKGELNNAITTNKYLLKMAEKIHKAKLAEDIADSKLEAKNLLKIDNLTNDLNSAVLKNEILLKNTQKVRNQVANIKKIGNESEQKHQEKIKYLAKNLKKSSGELALLTEKYNNREVWIKELKYFSREAFHKLLRGSGSKYIHKSSIAGNKSAGDISPNNKVVRSKDRAFKKQNFNNIASQQSSTYPNPSFMWGQRSQPAFPMMNGQTSTPGTRVFGKQNFNNVASQQSSKYPNPSFMWGQRSQKIPPATAVENLKNLAFQTNKIDQKNSFQGIVNQFKTKSSEAKVSGVIDNLKNLQKPKTKDDHLINFAVDATLKAVQKMTDYDVEKTNASMNLIGSGHELPQKLDAIIQVIKEQFNPTILNKALNEISNRYNQRLNFVNASLRHMYGTDGNKLTYWNIESEN